MAKQISEPLAGLDLVMGPMFAGKTTELLQKLNLFAEMGFRVIYVNSDLDVRDDLFSTHNPMLKKFDKIDYTKVCQISTLLSGTYIDNYDVFGIDEANLFTNLLNPILELVDKHQKRVVIAGINGNYERKPFGEFLNLIPHCDTIKFIKPFCRNCCVHNNIVGATFTHYLGQKNQTSDIDIGGNDKYIPLCRSCYNNFNRYEC